MSEKCIVRRRGGRWGGRVRLTRFRLRGQVLGLVVLVPVADQDERRRRPVTQIGRCVEHRESGRESRREVLIANRVVVKDSAR